MPIFNWPDKSSCGDTSPAQCTPLPYKEAVKAIRGTDQDTSCEVDLISEEHPAIPVILSDMVTEARSGSSANPIPINLMQEYTGGGPVPTLLYKNLAGEMQAWNPPINCNKKKVIVDGGNFNLADDVNSNVFEESCIGNIADADFITGAKTFVDCNGVTRVKLIFFDKNQLPYYS